MGVETRIQPSEHDSRYVGESEREIRQRIDQVNSENQNKKIVLKVSKNFGTIFLYEKWMSIDLFILNPENSEDESFYLPFATEQFFHSVILKRSRNWICLC